MQWSGFVWLVSTLRRRSKNKIQSYFSNHDSFEYKLVIDLKVLHVFKVEEIIRYWQLPITCPIIVISHSIKNWIRRNCWKLKLNPFGNGGLARARLPKPSTEFNERKKSVWADDGLRERARACDPAHYNVLSNEYV